MQALPELAWLGAKEAEGGMPFKARISFSHFRFD